MDYNKKKRVITNLLFVGLIALLIYVILAHVLRLVSPFIWAFVFAYILRRPALLLHKKIGLPYKLVAFAGSDIYCVIELLIALSVSSARYSRLTCLLPPLYANEIVPSLSSFFEEIEQAVSRMDHADTGGKHVIPIHSSHRRTGFQHLCQNGYHNFNLCLFVAGPVYQSGADGNFHVLYFHGYEG